MSEPSELPEYTAPKWAWWIATGFGSGRLNPAPGTWGSLAAWIAWFGLVCLIHTAPRTAFECILGLLTLLMVFVSVTLTGLIVRQVNVQDPSYIVFDEWVGMWLALWPTGRHVVSALNGGGWKYALVDMFAAFLLFRLFDIWKPWPIRKLESLPGGWGITLDDALSGILAGLIIFCAAAMKVRVFFV
ncbi:MAG: phosphatidylglycerophosphatase A [Holophagales bacterium]|jgi:phosphatidylglycerophosphatase A|nr:phosphatidylglycerophosphatase A [Holophagales bacterium]